MIGTGLAGWLRMVHATTRFEHSPPDLYAGVRDLYPYIVAMWHGDAFLLPFMQREGHRFSVMVSRSRDGDIIAETLRRLGAAVIRGSGGKASGQHRRGGPQALRHMLEALKSGQSVGMTADVPRTSRQAGRGIVTLARLSGRPIVPVAVATSRTLRLPTWDRTAINLPFSRGAFVVGEPLWVPDTLDAEGLERSRREVEAALDTVHIRAADLVR